MSSEAKNATVALEFRPHSYSELLLQGVNSQIFRHSEAIIRIDVDASIQLPVLVRADTGRDE